MLVLRTEVNRPLTHLELDGNFRFLDNAIGNLEDYVDSSLAGISGGSSVDSAAILSLVDSALVADRHTARKPSLSDVSVTPNYYINALTFDDNGHVVSVGTGEVTSSGGTIDSAQLEQAIIDALEDSFGVPTLTSVSNIVLDAQSAVVIQSGLFRLTSATTTQRNALPAQNGDLIYNTTANRIQGYQNGAWINIDDGTAG